MGHFEIRKEEEGSNKECVLHTFLAIKILIRKRWFKPSYTETIIVSKTRASNGAWALSQFTKELGDRYDYVVKADLVMNLNEHFNKV